jgi:signal transduction histidine kinase
MAGLAHESRNALQRSQVCLEMLADRVEQLPEALELIASIQKSQDDLHRLYEEVREFAAPIHLNRQSTDVGDVVRHAWAHLAPLYRGRQVQFQERLDSDDLTCKADPFVLGRVFRNILENALAACPDPVVIRVSYCVNCRDEKPALSVAIRDNGPGLSAEQQSRVFESFYTTKTKGTGLGMAIAQRMVEAHHGRITASHDGEPGAEFVVTLPRDNG